MIALCSDKFDGAESFRGIYVDRFAIQLLVKNFVFLILRFLRFWNFVKSSATK